MWRNVPASLTFHKMHKCVFCEKFISKCLTITKFVHLSFVTTNTFNASHPEAFYICGLTDVKVNLEISLVNVECRHALRDGCELNLVKTAWSKKSSRVMKSISGIVSDMNVLVSGFCQRRIMDALYNNVMTHNCFLLLGSYFE